MKKSFKPCFISFTFSTVLGIFIPNVNYMVFFNNIWYLIFYYIYIINVKINTKIINSSKISQVIKDNSINQMNLITGKVGKSIFIIGCIFIQSFFSIVFWYILKYGNSNNTVVFSSVVLVNNDFIVNNTMLLFIAWNIIQIIANALFIITLLIRMKQDKI